MSSKKKKKKKFKFAVINKNQNFALCFNFFPLKPPINAKEKKKITRQKG